MGSESTAALERIIAESASAADPRFKTELTRLFTAIKRRRESGKASSRDFFVSAIRLLSRIRGLQHAEIRMDCLFESGLFFYTCGDSERACETAHHLQNLAARTQIPAWIRKAHNLSGIVHADAGNVADAVTYHTEALRISRSLGDRETEFIGLNNLGIALVYGGLYRDAIPCFQVAIREARVLEGVRRWLPNALANLAQADLYLERYDDGIAAIEESLALTPHPYDAELALSRAIREYTFVQLALGSGRIADARLHCERCAESARSADSDKARILETITRGLCEIHDGDSSLGLTMLESLLSSKSDWSRTDILIALVKGYDAAERPEEALKHLRTLLEHVKAERAKTAQAVLKSATLATASSNSEVDLQPYEIRELKLRARAAEHQAISSRFEMLERLAVTADLKEDASGEHGYRVGRLSALMGEELGWSKEACLAIDHAARLHDIGKIAMPDRILLTSEQLKEAERHLMSTHTLVGAELLAKSNIPQLQMAEEIARFHHEWWNGAGYPSKRKEKRIPVHARIVALADVFDALTHGRPFSEPWSMDRALEEIAARRGTQFDPELADIFLDLVARLRKRHKDLDAYLGKAGLQSPFLQARHKIRLMLAEPSEAP